MEDNYKNNLSKFISSSNLPKKRLRHNFLCIKDKLELIEKYKQGYSKSALSREYCIGKSTVGDIINYENNLISFQKHLSIDELNKRKKTKRKKFEKNQVETQADAKFEDDDLFQVNAQDLKESKFISHSEALDSINLLVEYLEDEFNSKLESLNYLKVLQNMVRCKALKNKNISEERL